MAYLGISEDQTGTKHLREPRAMADETGKVGCHQVVGGLAFCILGLDTDFVGNRNVVGNTRSL